ncbi:hypothetical protein [Elizabethkingia meningoseptica]|uniref:hypothetical protein n=1 Tax=Elizabethkingia meningoseptica TaxID=238 RepID=UPI000994C010|nr:hypothetical protein [Elizabethkingia meningoseptica]MCT3917498.1 hypothetical protein [Elizabethkingia anophelis]AQX12510.1 hypothetical protein BBD35_09060 [Elizabethkingia meningoseptica]MCT4034860.1 hypothetical protein [Elizabethkingia anophelis]MCT4085499.1 hypothetical protein [Elizabethkingia anophelis]MCT4156945.1 hypothetical protein [Elizabethkingia anophelis]
MSENNENKAELYPKNGEITFIMPSTNAIGALKNAETNRKLTVSYLKKEQWIAEEGKPVECFFLGFKEASDAKGNPYFLVKLHDGEKAFVAGQTVLVQALMNTTVGQGVRITCTGTTKTTGGNEIPLFDVDELNINIFDNADEE